MATWRHEQHILGTMLLFYDWVPEVNVQESQAESDIELPHQMHGCSHVFQYKSTLDDSRWYKGVKISETFPQQL